MKDNEIINLYLQRSQESIVETKKKYGAYSRAIAKNILLDALDIEECENDTYLALWNTIPPNIPKILKVFIGRIARNIALDKYSYNTAKKRNKEFEVVLTELEECLAAPHTVEDEYEEGEIARAISQFLYLIDEEPRNLFIRRYWYNDSIEELARMFDMSPSKVKSMLFRVRNKLRFYLQEQEINL